MSTEQSWMNHVQNWLELLSDYLHVFYYRFEGHCEYGRLFIVVILSNLFSSLSPLSKGSGGLSICRIPFSTNYWFNACRTCLGNSISSKRTVSSSHRLLRIWFIVSQIVNWLPRWPGIDMNQMCVQEILPSSWPRIEKQICVQWVWVISSVTANTDCNGQISLNVQNIANEWDQ